MESHDLLIIRKHDDDTYEVRFDAQGEDNTISLCTCLYHLFLDHPVIPHVMQAIGEIVCEDDKAMQEFRESKVEMPDFNKILNK
jgi:hypothetical protein